MKNIKVPSPWQRPNGKWSVQVVVNGKKHSITEDTAEACIAKAMAIKQNLLEAKDNSKKPTLSEAIDQYIEDRYKLLSPPTRRGYRIIQRNRFKDAMDKPVDYFDESGWRKLINTELKKVSLKTVKNAWALTNAVIEATTKKKIKITLSKKTNEKALTKKIKFLPWDEIKQFLKAAEDDKYEIAAMLALHSLRVSEITALTWDKIDFKRNTILVEGAFVPDENNRYVDKDENKNDTSARIVPIMIPRLRELLEENKNKTEKVVPWHPSSILNGVKRICIRAGVTVVGTHGLRHSFASLAWKLEIPPKVAQMIGGWKDDSTMQKIYTHVSRLDVISYKNKMSAFYESE